MSITIVNQVENARGVYFEFTGDGATTVIPVTHNSVHARPAPSVTATVFTNATPKRDNGGPSGNNTGLLGNHGGTAVTVSTATHAAGKSTVTLAAAAANATVHYAEVTFNNYCD